MAAFTRFYLSLTALYKERRDNDHTSRPLPAAPEKSMKAALSCTSRWLPLLSLLALSPLPAAAADLSWSGFGTVGYAISDQSYRYQRFIDKHGSFDRDSIVGVQMNATFSPQWGASLQATAAPSTRSDNNWQATPSWAFLSWRPSNDLLLRVGKLRVPMYLNSENLNVGTTFDFMRLPAEVYTTAPTTDFTGIALDKTWELASGDVALDGYWGKAKVSNRMIFNQQPTFVAMDTESAGLVLTFRQSGEHGDNIYRAGMHQTRTGPTDSSPPALPADAGDGNARPERRTISAPVFTIGADLALANDWRSIGEVAYRTVKQGEQSRATWGAYVAVLKRIGRWTPYLSNSRLHSDHADGPGDGGQSNGDTSGSLSTAAASLGAFDQSAWAIGTSYALSPSSKLKGEWLRAHIGSSSSLVDAPASGSISQQNVNVLSLSYNFVF